MSYFTFFCICPESLKSGPRSRLQHTSVLASLLPSARKPRVAGGSHTWTQHRAGPYPGARTSPFLPLGLRNKTKYFVQASTLSRQDAEPHCLWGQANHGGPWSQNRDAQNLLEAASNGATVSVKLVGNIGANLIAFLALLAFVNAALSWLGAMVGAQELSFQVPLGCPLGPRGAARGRGVGGRGWTPRRSAASPGPGPTSCPCLVPQLICSYALRPVAFLMGVAWEDCPVVAELLGIKLFLNEFVAYQELSQYKQRRLAGAEEWVGAKKQWISVSVPVPSLRQGCHAAAPGAPGRCCPSSWTGRGHTEMAPSLPILLPWATRWPRVSLPPSRSLLGG